MPPPPTRDVFVRALREQALAALRELCRVFGDADRLAGGGLYIGPEKEIYPGLVRVLLRMVVILFAEAHGLLPMADDVHGKSHSLSRLYTELEVAAREHGAAL